MSVRNFTKLRTLTVILYPRFQLQAAGNHRPYSIIPTLSKLQQDCEKFTKLLNPIPTNRPQFTSVRIMSHSTCKESKDKGTTEEKEELVAKAKENEMEDLEEELRKINEKLPVKKLGTAEKLKLAIRDYGGTVLVFHVTMSIMSLGSCYLLVSSGLDIVGLLSRIGISESILESRITQGGSTFVLAYAIHKVFAPVRLAITLTAVPFIVKKLRAIGFLKKPV